ncbi:MAG: sialidase family protein [Actinomycetota bacterium]
MRPRLVLLTLPLVLATTVLYTGGTAVGARQPDRPRAEKMPSLSGVAALRQLDLGTGLTECPQAGRGLDLQPRPLDRRQIDQVEQISGRGDDTRMNQDFSCFPQNETSVAVNPRRSSNVVAGQNDYRLGWGTSGFDVTTDGGANWYDGIIPFPSLPSGDNLDGGGDPAIAFDRAGIVYYADINFNRTNDTNGIFVSRSTNGGFTWTRPCVPLDTTPTGLFDNEGKCGPAAAPPLSDPRQPGDGVVVFDEDPDGEGPLSVPFHDKEYIAVGPRPQGVEPVCFSPFTRDEIECDPDNVGIDRVYVTWTRFDFGPLGVLFLSSEILLSFSDDEGRSWSPPRPISGSAPFCIGFPAGVTNDCNVNQFSVPTVHPGTGFLGVAFQNFNTPDENQYLFVRSRDGGQTFEGPFFVTPVFDANYPRAGAPGGRPDCTRRGQQSGRPVLSNSCFRVNSGGNVVFDSRPGAFADDVYLVMSDNRNGTPARSNTDVFFFKSTDFGTTWIGPTRVNDDPSQLQGDRDDPENTAVTGNDQWFPWVDVGPRGHVNVAFYDRRLDQNSQASEWPESRQHPGNYLVWRWSSLCQVSATEEVTQESTEIPRAASQCLAPEAEIILQPEEPIDPGEEAQPGQTQSAFPFRNFTLSDVPSNWDYSFRAGIFAGDYDVIDVHGLLAVATWTDARNGRSSRHQPGRNPPCEQSDAFVDTYDATRGGAPASPRQTDQLFLVTECPAAATR